MTITALPTAPQRSDPANFATRADAWITQFTGTTVGEINSTATAINANQVAAAMSETNAAASAVAASASASSAATNATAAAASAGASIWVSGTTYAIGDVRYSPSNKRIYRRITAGAGTTDPSADATNWAAVGVWMPTTHVSTTTVTATPGALISLENVAASAVTANTTPTDDEEFVVWGNNGLTTNTVDFGARVVRGPFGTLNIITLDTP